MKSVECAHILVVASGDRKLLLAQHLCRIGVARATFVPDIGAARRACLAGGVDVCLVVVGGDLADAIPEVDSDAPGKECGVPSLMVAGAVVTPHLRRTARNSGYHDAISASIAPRMLYRRIGALFQRRAARPARHRPREGVHAGLFAAELGDFHKATRH